MLAHTLEMPGQDEKNNFYCVFLEHILMEEHSKNSKKKNSERIADIPKILTHLPQWGKDCSAVLHILMCWRNRSWKWWTETIVERCNLLKFEDAQIPAV